MVGKSHQNTLITHWLIFLWEQKEVWRDLPCTMAVWHLRSVIPRGDAISLRLWQWTSSPTSSSMPLSTMEKGWEKMRIYGKKNYSRNLWQMVWSYVNDKKVNDKTRNENTRQIIKCTKIDKIRIVKSKKKKIYRELLISHKATKDSILTITFSLKFIPVI